jgi:spore germination protein YaaH
MRKTHVVLVFALTLLSRATVALAQEPPVTSHQLLLEQYRDFEPPPSLKKAEEILPLQPRATLGPTRQVFGYLPYWSSYANFQWDLLSTVAYFGIEFDRNGNITNKHGWPRSDLISLAHNKGVKVQVVAICFNNSQDRERVHALLTSSTSRQRFIDNVIAQVKAGQVEGVNLDFEFPPASDRDLFTLLTQELASQLQAAVPGAEVTMAAPAVNWSNRYDRLALAGILDAFFIMGYDYHWSGSATAGPVAPLAGETYNVTRTVDDYLQATNFARDKLILGVPYFGLEWDTVNEQPLAATTSKGRARFYAEAESRAETYGKLWYSPGEVPWYRFFENGTWKQGWYDDSLSLSKKYELAINRDLAGVGIWALGYDEARPELWDALRVHFGGPANQQAPTTPRRLVVQATGNDRAVVRFDTVPGAEGYLVYRSSDGVNFDTGTFADEPPVVLTGIAGSEPVFIKVVATNSVGQSEPTELLGVFPGLGDAQVLVVNGFDRITGTVNTHDFIRQHGDAIAAAGVGFDASNNEAVIAGDVSLLDYVTVVWILGEEGTATSSFDASEKALVREFLRSGGRLFVSGSEIGYDLVQRGSADDKAFFRDFLKAEYVRDDVGSYTAEGIPGSLFSGITGVRFDDGSHGGYDVDYPDGIKPVGGAEWAMTYTGVDAASRGGAAIAFSGIFPGGSEPGKLVYLAFPFEMIIDQSVRQDIMLAALQFFGVTTGVARERRDVVPEVFALKPNYPNPFNGRTTAVFVLRRARDIEIVLYNVLGQQVRKLFQGRLPAGEHRLSFSLDGLPSGIYLARFVAGREVKTQRWLYQK